MKINEMTLDELNLEIKRGKFWIEDNPIKESLRLINKMENRKHELLLKSL